MRAVIVGGNGFIGSHLIDSLLVEGWEVVVYDRTPERYRLPLVEVEYITGELGNENLLTSILPGADAVFHLASTTIHQSSNESPVFDIQSNLIDTVRFLKLCVKCRVGKVIFLSSGGTVYGVPDSMPVNEKHPTNPICSYGIVKLAIEKYLHLFNHLYGLSYMILRPSVAYGPRQNPSGKQGAIAVFLGCIAQGKPVTIWGDGETIRDYLHVSDLVRACMLAATATHSDMVFNVGSGQGISLNQLLEIIERVVQKPFSVERQPARPFDVPRLILDTLRARTDLQWTPEVQLEEGISRTWNWIRSLEWSTNPSMR